VAYLIILYFSRDGYWEVAGFIKASELCRILWTNLSLCQPYLVVRFNSNTICGIFGSIAARRVAIKMARRLHCSSVTYRFRYAPFTASPARTRQPGSGRLAGGPF
jgi:hypothetical protein